MGLWGSIFSHTKIWCSHHVLIAPETNKQLWNFGVVAVLWLEIPRYMLSGVEISVTTNNIIDVSWPRYFNTAVFLTHWWPGGRAFFGFMADFSSILPDAPPSGSGRNASPAGSVAWLSTDGGGMSLGDSVVTSLEKFWRSLELLYYNILYIYIVYKNTI